MYRPEEMDKWFYSFQMEHLSSGSRGHAHAACVCVRLDSHTSSSLLSKCVCERHRRSEVEEEEEEEDRGYKREAVTPSGGSPPAQVSPENTA